MSKFEDYWELQQSFPTYEAFYTWLTNTYDPSSMIYLGFDIEDGFYEFQFSIADFENTSNFASADRIRKQRTGKEFRMQRSDADIYWKHVARINFNYERAMVNSTSCQDCHGTIIITTTDGNHVFTRKAGPKPALRS